jgi:hypothetical protein
VAGIFIALPYYNCDAQGVASQYSINYKEWILIFLVLSMLKNMKYYIDKSIHACFDRGGISYRTRSCLLVICEFGVEICHLAWQLYGNFIYWEWRGKTEENDDAWESCMDENNRSLLLVMFLFLLVGYLYFILFTYVFVVVTIMLLHRGRGRRERINNSALILNSLSRIQFSESLFGALSNENECIICMQSYKTEDMITNLGCNERHFFHTECIEEWIRRGNNQCPICRKPMIEGAQQLQ